MTDSIYSTLSDADLVLARSTLFKNTLNIPMPPLPPDRERGGWSDNGRRQADRTDSLSGMARSYLGLAEVARARGDLTEAEQRYRQALAIFQSLSEIADTPDTQGVGPAP